MQFCLRENGATLGCLLLLALKAILVLLLGFIVGALLTLESLLSVPTSLTEGVTSVAEVVSMHSLTNSFDCGLSLGPNAYLGECCVQFDFGRDSIRDLSPALWQSCNFWGCMRELFPLTPPEDEDVVLHTGIDEDAGSHVAIACLDVDCKGPAGSHVEIGCLYVDCKGLPFCIGRGDASVNPGLGANRHEDANLGVALW